MRGGNTSHPLDIDSIPGAVPIHRPLGICSFQSVCRPLYRYSSGVVFIADMTYDVSELVAIATASLNLWPACYVVRPTWQSSATILPRLASVYPCCQAAETVGSAISSQTSSRRQQYPLPCRAPSVSQLHAYMHLTHCRSAFLDHTFPDYTFLDYPCLDHTFIIHVSGYHTCPTAHRNKAGRMSPGRRHVSKQKMASTTQ